MKLIAKRAVKRENRKKERMNGRGRKQESKLWVAAHL